MMQQKNVIVIGGSSGIGLYITKKLIDSGAHVKMFSRTLDPSHALPAGTHLPLDITSEDISKEDIYDPLQGLVYCPGSIKLRPFHRLSKDDFLSDFEINLFGAIKAIQACLPALKKSKNGASIVLFSTVAVQTGMPFHASIASAKGAIEGLTRSLAAELAPRVRVNAIAPSLTDTPLAQQLLSDDNKRKAAAERHPLKTIGNPADIAHAAIFLLSDQAAWVSGQILPVDGGMGSIRTFK